MKPRRNSAGFTLLELIVVVAIFAVLSAMAYGGLNSVLTTRAAVERAMDRTADFQRAYLRLRSDLGQVRDRPVRDGFGERQPAVVLTSDRVLEVTRGGWRNPLSAPRPTLQRVAYRLDEARLIRASWNVLDRAQDSEPDEAVVLERVQEVSWRFLDGERRWQERWPPANISTADGSEHPPPLAIEMSLRTEDWGEMYFLFPVAWHRLQ